MAWSELNAEIAVTNRFMACQPLVSLLKNPESDFRPEGTGDEAFPAVNYYIMDTVDPELPRYHTVQIFFYVDTQDQPGLIGRNQCLELDTIIDTEFNRDPQAANPVPFLDLSIYQCKVMGQRLKSSTNPILQPGGDPPSYRKVLIYELIVVDYS